MYHVVVALTFGLSLNAHAGRFTAKNATEAELKFRGRVFMEAAQAPTADQARKKIEKQVLHLFGPMGRNPRRASPLGNHAIGAVAVREIRAPLYEATYEYTGRAIVAQGPETEYPILLPLNPDKIYAAATVVQLGKKSYPCTDAHHYEESAFWYYWYPFRANCRLREGKDFAIWKASLRRFPNMTRSYPEYARLAHDGTIRMDTFFGMNDPKLGPNPLTSGDINAGNFRLLRQELQRLGFAGRVWSAEEIRSVVGATTARLPYVEEYSRGTARARLVARLFFGATGLYEGSQPFHYFLKDSLENAAVMVYDGHSGFGSNLHLGRIESMEKFPIALPTSRYQILFFNSCSSYPYYRSQYFGRKVTEADPQGTRELDILTTGNETMFSVMGQNSVAVTRAVYSWATGQGTLSYQQWATQIDSNNLFGVNGDEDNPETP